MPNHKKASTWITSSGRFHNFCVLDPAYFFFDMFLIFCHAMPASLAGSLDRPENRPQNEDFNTSPK